MQKSNDPRIAELRAILNHFDPIELIEMGCPQDEYDPEIARILQAVAECKNVEALSAMMRSVYAQMFDEEITGRFPDWDKLADEVWEKMRGDQRPIAGRMES